MKASVNNKYKAFTSLEQSRKLAEILPLESADMCYLKREINNTFIETPIIKPTGDVEKSLPCWSLAALLSVLPEIQGGKPVIALDDNYITYPHMSDLHTKADNLVDACYEIILKLNELKML